MPNGLRSPDRPTGAGQPLLASAHELAIGAGGADVRHACEWLDDACRRGHVPQVQVERLALCLHEVLANVLAHGGSGALAAPIGLRLEIRRDGDRGDARVTVSDAGVAFNPLAVADKKLPKTLDEASAGGLGLVMIRRCADRFDYRREGGRNHLTIGVRWDSR